MGFSLENSIICDFIRISEGVNLQELLLFAIHRMLATQKFNLFFSAENIHGKIVRVPFVTENKNEKICLK